MKICPIAIAVGCPKCALFKVCPVKGVVGGYKEPASPGSARPSKEVLKKT